MALQAIRSVLFYILFIGQTVILAITLGTMSMFTNGWFRLGWALVLYWASSTLFMLRWIIGIRSEVSGMENIPEGGCIIAAKHQSDWDIFALFPHVGRPAYITKKELIDIPFFGKTASTFDAISIDRKKGSDAFPAMMAEARAAIDRGCRIIIFPEGTRKAPLADPDYRFGVAKLYKELKVPVVPVALNSGLFWGRNSLVLWPGTAKARFLPAIPAGLSAKKMHDRMAADIEKATNELIVDSVEQGLTRPITSDFRARLNAFKNKKS